MKAFIITTIIIEVLQFCAFFAIITTDVLDTRNKKDYMIQTKMDVLKFLVPYFWFIPMIRLILKWWYSLK